MRRWSRWSRERGKQKRQGSADPGPASLMTYARVKLRLFCFFFPSQAGRAPKKGLPVHKHDVGTSIILRRPVKVCLDQDVGRGPGIRRHSTRSLTSGCAVGNAELALRRQGHVAGRSRERASTARETSGSRASGLGSLGRLARPAEKRACVRLCRLTMIDNLSLM
jgi:hypothetical protein